MTLRFLGALIAGPWGYAVGQHIEWRLDGGSPAQKELARDRQRLRVERLERELFPNAERSVK